MGSRELARRGAAKAARKLAAAVRRPPAERFAIEDPRTIAQLRALAFFRASLDALAEERTRLAARRRRSDRELFERFPLWLVPTYPGDESLFASPGFAACLPGDLRFERASLSEVMAWPE